MNEILRYIVQLDPSYCCIKQLLVSERKKPTSVLAKELGLSPRTIRYWRRKLKLGECKCEHAEGCHLLERK